MTTEEEIKQVEAEILRLKTDVSNENKLKSLKKQLAQLQFQTKHPRLLGFTGRAEKSAKGFFGALGSGFRKAGTALEKSDAYIAREKAKESELNKKKPTKQRSAVEEASLGID